MKIAVITSGFLPIPATKGGAVENLFENIMKRNEKTNDMKLCIFSCYDKETESEARKYNSSQFLFIKTNFFVKICDKFIFFIAKNLLKKKNSHSYRFILQRLDYLNKVSKNLKKNNYDLILLENHPTQFLTLKWRKNYKKYAGRYYYHCHNEFVETYGCDEVIKWTKKFISVSKYISKNSLRLLGLKSEQCYVLRNGIDDSKFKINLTPKEKLAIKEKYGIDYNDKVLLFTGRLVREKGISELLEALNYVKSKNYKLMIVGSALNDIKVKTEFEVRLEELAEKNNNKIIFTGFVKYDEIPKIYSIADIAILPSIWDDPAPLTIIESLTCGLPIITTNSGGIPEYANHKCAIILKRDNNLSKNIAKSIDKLINNDDLRKKMSSESILASKELTLENYYNDFYNLMKG